jgi:hypothetical protein
VPIWIIVDNAVDSKGLSASICGIDWKLYGAQQSADGLIPDLPAMLISTLLQGRISSHKPVGQKCREKGGKMARRRKKIKQASWQSKTTTCVQVLGGSARIIVACVSLAQLIDDCFN